MVFISNPHTSYMYRSMRWEAVVRSPARCIAAGGAVWGGRGMTEQKQNGTCTASISGTARAAGGRGSDGAIQDEQGRGAVAEQRRGSMWLGKAAWCVGGPGNAATRSDSGAWSRGIRVWAGVICNIDTDRVVCSLEHMRKI